MPELSRRSVLTSGIGAALLSALPPSVQQAMAMPPPKGGLSAIDHVVVFMQENRAFDSYFGTLRGARGFDDRTAMELPDGRTVFEQPDGAGGRVLPFSAREAAAEANRPDSDVQYLGSLDHTWDTGYRAWANGWMNEWIAAKGPGTMAYYDRQDIPLQFALAETFTFCDAYHCSLRGPTNPNRLYQWTGTVGHEPGTGRRVIGNEASQEDTHPGYDWTTYTERLEEAGVSWQTYQEWDNYQCNSPEYFVTFKKIAEKVLAKVDGGHRSLHSFYADIVQADARRRERLLAQRDAGVARLSPAERSLYDRALHRAPQGELVTNFRADIRAGRLPQVSYIVTPEIDSEHPSESTPANSAGTIYQVLDAIASDPDVWSRTVVLLNYDENDGYFDHVPQPTAPPRHHDEYTEGKPLGLGQRVPMTIVSPWTVGGYMCSELFDHTSVIRFLEEYTGVREPNISAWRRTAMGDLLSAFDFTDGQPAPDIPPAEPVPPVIDHWKASPPEKQVMPRQEPGRRPARALPYRPAVSAALSARTLTLSMDNPGERSAHLIVYPYRGEFDSPQHVDLHGARREQIDVNGSYRLHVHGPNRFLRVFAGHTDGAATPARVEETAERSGRVLLLRLCNDGPQPLTFRTSGDLGQPRDSTEIHLSPGAAQQVRWTTTGGWYDVTVTIAEDDAFLRRLTGRLENGQPGVTP